MVWCSVCRLVIVIIINTDISSLQPLSLSAVHGDGDVTQVLLKDDEANYRRSQLEGEGAPCPTSALKPSAPDGSWGDIPPARIGYGDRRFAIGSWCHSGELVKSQGTTSIARDLFGKDD